MNYQALHELIKLYKDNFTRINHLEIYKWEAVKHFQDHWHIDSDDFTGMLKNALSKAGNLMDSGKYFPRRMIFQFAESDPETVRTCFKNLYDESKDLYDRLNQFNTAIREVWQTHYSNLDNYYQDPRARLVYLNFRYPDTYFFYKFRMFQKVAKRIEYPCVPKKSKVQDVFHYTNMCYQILHEIKKDNELLIMHQERLNEHCYADPKFHILTQDIIYAADKHLDNFSAVPIENFHFDLIDTDYTIFDSQPSFTGRFVDYQGRQAEMSRIGLLGEQYVFERECNLIASYNIRKKPRHVSVEDGDGLGFDILSYNSDGSEKYIEVKTTTGHFHTPFYITRTELNKSREHPNKYWLYRVCNFNESEKKASLMQIPGDLSPFCENPSQYLVKLSPQHSSIT
ncbi:protein of unknown function [Filimonas lacunae]|uniref:Protein NO VEIN C-terminal domain-containing protein n=1 Tax=Filimonas lacunae TaxID=477680 RepID=A0A173MH25_9BACT|nr:DUF3883 domain-containing protein [Filimonas lacunae]BAV06790.1 hypothetical protein FLA_2810 [Filimonas lacunae]SIT34351.1 protein of unknown function [Filimonas lacunae]